MLEMENNVLKLKIEFPRYAGPFSDEEICEAIEEKIGIDDVNKLGPLKFANLWSISFNNKENAEKLQDIGEIQIGNHKGIVQNANSRIVKGKISWIPFFEENEQIIKELKNFGEVLSFQAEKKVVRGKMRETNIRLFSLKLDMKNKPDDVPHLLRCGEYTGLVHIQGRKPKCLRCGKIGHLRKNCMTKKCLLCNSYFHMEEECPKKITAMETSQLPGIINDEDDTRKRKNLSTDEERSESPDAKRPAPTNDETMPIETMEEEKNVATFKTPEQIITSKIMKIRSSNIEKDVESTKPSYVEAARVSNRVKKNKENAKGHIPEGLRELTKLTKGKSYGHTKDSEIDYEKNVCVKTMFEKEKLNKERRKSSSDAS